MKLDLDIIKPNLYSVGDEVCFGIYPYVVIPASKLVNEVVRKHVGELKVRETDLPIANEGIRTMGEDLYTLPLIQFLESLKGKSDRSSYEGISKDSARKFGLSYIIDSSTIENVDDGRDWRNLQRVLASPQKFFDSFEKDVAYRLDRKKTLKEMKKLEQELAHKVSDHVADFTIVRGRAPYQGEIKIAADLGVISLLQLKKGDRKKIEETKSDLISVLREFEGPLLSLDAPRINSQIFGLYESSHDLVNSYRDVFTPSWKDRLFS